MVASRAASLLANMLPLFILNQSNTTLDLPFFQILQPLGKVLQLPVLDWGTNDTLRNQVQNLLQVPNLAAVAEDVAQPLPSPRLHVDRVLGVDTPNAKKLSSSAHFHIGSARQHMAGWGLIRAEHTDILCIIKGLMCPHKVRDGIDQQTPLLDKLDRRLANRDNISLRDSQPDSLVEPLLPDIADDDPGTNIVNDL